MTDDLNYPDVDLYNYTASIYCVQNAVFDFFISKDCVQRCS